MQRKYLRNDQTYCTLNFVIAKSTYSQHSYFVCVNCRSTKCGNSIPCLSMPDLGTLDFHTIKVLTWIWLIQSLSKVQAEGLSITSSWSNIDFSLTPFPSYQYVIFCYRDSRSHCLCDQQVKVIIDQDEEFFDLISSRELCKNELMIVFTKGEE